jgi:hypothetical protein
LSPTSLQINTDEFAPALGGGTFAINESGSDIRLIFSPAEAVAPDIRALGTNLAYIANNDVPPLLSDGTDFGSVLRDGGTKTQTFTITNSGNSALSVDNVVVGGAHASDFTVTFAADTWSAPNLITSNPDWEQGAAGWNDRARIRFSGRVLRSVSETRDELPDHVGERIGLSGCCQSLKAAVMPFRPGWRRRLPMAFPGMYTANSNFEWKGQWRAARQRRRNVFVRTFGTNGSWNFIIPSGQWTNIVLAGMTAPSGAVSAGCRGVWNGGTGGGRGAFDNLQVFQEPGFDTNHVRRRIRSVRRRDAIGYGLHTNNFSGKIPLHFALRGTGVAPRLRSARERRYRERRRSGLQLRVGWGGVFVQSSDLTITNSAITI